MTQTHSLSPRHLGKEHAARFSADGFLLIHNFMPSENIDDIRASIIKYGQKGPVIQVRWKSSSFDTLNGRQIDENFPGLGDLYDHHMLDLLSQFHTEKLAPVADRRIGISVNLTRQEGKFEPHYDRNAMTAILYANDDYDGGEMTFYPRIRFWLGQPTGRMKHLLQRLLDKMVRNRWYLRFIARKVVVKPRAGDLLVFEGTRTLHAVMPVSSGATRLSIQFAYDQPGMAFDASNYYGK